MTGSKGSKITLGEVIFGHDSITIRLHLSLFQLVGVFFS
jgi:hypothetical protein